MVQEVQQQWNRYQTPNEIQGIWDIRRRVREHTQVTPSFSYECKVNWSVQIILWPHQTEEKRGTISTIYDEYGNTKFKIVNDWLSIPLAWAYRLTISWKGGTIYVPYNHILKIDGNQIVTFQSTSDSTPTTITKVLNLWRGNIIEYYGKLSSWDGGLNRTGTITISIEKL